ncbi:response regulator transcription factor [Pseudoneobacillus sp. C159]
MGVKVLIVEDEIRISNLLKLYLERESCQVEIATDGIVGLEKALQQDFDIIFLDLFMPGKDGFQVLEELRKIKNTPVMILSAHGESEAQVRAFELGADDYILKPFSPRELVEKVKSAIDQLNQEISE